MNDPRRPRSDLRYGILVRNLPDDCDTLVARVIDVGGNSVTSTSIAVPNQTAIDEFVDFEDGEMPPAGWKRVRSLSGSGTTVANDTSAAHSGSRGMLCVDASTTEGGSQRAGIELGCLRALSVDRRRLVQSGGAGFEPESIDSTASFPERRRLECGGAHDSP